MEDEIGGGNLVRSFAREFVNITMIGAGYVGLVSAACFSEFGWTVTCIDKDPSKIEHLRQGGVPIYEPRLDELLHRNLRMGRIAFSSESRALHAHRAIWHIVAEPDLRHLRGGLICSAAAFRKRGR